MPSERDREPTWVGLPFVSLRALSPPRLHVLRSHILGAVRRFFDEQGFLEVDTPVLVTAPAPERFIEAPAVTLTGPTALNEQQRFLQTSPELAMKQLLADGHERIYQVAPCFRDGDWSDAHCPEFRMLEWYRAGADWQAGMTDCEGVLRASVRAAHAEGESSLPLPPWAQRLVSGEPIERVRMDEAFWRYAHIDLAQATEASALRDAMRKRGLYCMDDDQYDELCHRILVGVIEPALLRQPRPVFLTHFPLPLASWAAPCKREPLFAERFELYVAGRELANGFTELLDATALAQRFAIEQNERRNKHMHAYADADAFFARLPHIPPCVGIALGIDRLLMAALHRDHINDVQFVPFDRV